MWSGLKSLFRSREASRDAAQARVQKDLKRGTLPGLGDHCPFCSGGRIGTYRAAEGKRSSQVIRCWLVCVECDWRPSAETWTEDTAGNVIRPETEPVEVLPAFAQQPTSEPPTGFNGFTVRLRPGAVALCRMINGERRRFQPGDAVRLTEAELLGVENDIRKGFIQPVDWVEQRREWQPIALDELDFDQMLWSIRSKRSVSQILDRSTPSQAPPGHGSFQGGGGTT